MASTTDTTTDQLDPTAALMAMRMAGAVDTTQSAIDNTQASENPTGDSSTPSLSPGDQGGGTPSDTGTTPVNPLAPVGPVAPPPGYMENGGSALSGDTLKGQQQGGQAAALAAMAAPSGDTTSNPLTGPVGPVGPPGSAYEQLQALGNTPVVTAGSGGVDITGGRVGSGGPGTVVTAPPYQPSTTTPGTGVTTANPGTGATGPGPGTGTTQPGTGTSQPGTGKQGNLPNVDPGTRVGPGEQPGQPVQPGQPGGGATTNLAGGGPGGGGPGTLSGVTSDLMGQLASIQQQVNNPQAPNDVIAMYRQGLTDILSLLNQQEENARAEAAKQGSQFDPATQNALDVMRTELDRQIKEQDMALNARGLFNSGILAQVETNLRTGNMSDQAKVISGYLTKVQDNLQKQLEGIMTARTGAITGLTEKGLAGQLDENQFVRKQNSDLQDRLLNARLSFRGQLNTANENALNRAAENQRAAQTLAAENSRNDATLNNQRLLEQMRINAGAYRGTAGGGTAGSTALGGGVASRAVNNNGKTVTTYKDGTSSEGQSVLASLQKTFGNDKESMYNAFAQNVQDLMQNGLTQADVQNIMQNITSGPEGADITGVTHGH